MGRHGSEERHLRRDQCEGGARVVITNQWRDEKYGSTMYKLNNAAMEVLDQTDGSLLLRCSDGWGDADFNDLVVQVVAE